MREHMDKTPPVPDDVRISVAENTPHNIVILVESLNRSDVRSDASAKKAYERANMIATCGINQTNNRMHYYDAAGERLTDMDVYEKKASPVWYGFTYNFIKSL